MYAVYGERYIPDTYGEFETVFIEEGYSSKNEAEYRAEELNERARKKNTDIYYSVGYYFSQEKIY